MYTPSCFAAAELAAAELNVGVGVGGRRLALRLIDGSSAHGSYLADISGGVRAGSVQAVTGVHPSFVRDSVYSAIGGRVPYLFPSVWEGGAREPGLLCTGETPAVQSWPAVRWINENAGVRRWIVVGEDYVWPRETARYLAPRLRQQGAWIDAALVSYEDLEAEERRDEAMERLITRVEHSGADGVIMLFVGAHAALFNRAFAARGLDASLLRFSPLMDENMLLASGPDATRGLLSAGTYVNAVETPDTRRLAVAYAARHGEVAPPLNQLAVSLYDSIRLIAKLADEAGPGRFDVDGLDQAIQGGFTYAGPRGEIHVDRDGIRQDINLYVANGCEFDWVETLS